MKITLLPFLLAISCQVALAEKCAGFFEVSFPAGAFGLPADARNGLYQVIEAHRQGVVPEVFVLIGHADSKESQYGDVAALALQRAETAKLLLLRGYPEFRGRVFAEGKGSTQPKSTTDSSKNRRLKFELTCSISRPEAR